MNMRRLFRTLIYELDLDISIEIDQERERKSVRRLMPLYYKKKYKTTVSDFMIDVAIAKSLLQSVSRIPSPDGITALIKEEPDPPAIPYSDSCLNDLDKTLRLYEYGGWMIERAQELLRGAKCPAYGMLKARDSIWLTCPVFDEGKLVHICCANPFSGQLGVAPKL